MRPLILLLFVWAISVPGTAQEEGVKRPPFNFWAFAERLRAATDGFNISYEAAEKFYQKERVEDLAAFLAELRRKLEESYRWDVWAVGAIVEGHVGLEFFSSYQIWLTLQGRDFYESVLKDPTRAVERLPVKDPSTDFSFLFLETAALNTLRDRTGKEQHSLRDRLGKQPAGRPWTWRELSNLHPRLWDDYFVKRDRRPARPDLRKMKDEDLVWYTVDAVRDWVDIYEDPAYLLEQYKLLNPAQRGLHAVVWLKSEADNGGLDQFFHNSTGVVAPEALEGLKLFEAIEYSDELSAVMKAFPGGVPEGDRAKRQAQMEERWPRSKEKGIDDEFPGGKKKAELETYVSKYIRAHPDEFFKPM